MHLAVGSPDAFAVPPKVEYCPTSRLYTALFRVDFSEELWLTIFFFVSEDCPAHTFMDLSEISAVSKRAAAALAARRSEHLRLALVDLQVEREYDIIMQDRDDDIMAFHEAWFVDSDGHWHDRFDRHYYDSPPRRPRRPSCHETSILQARRLELAAVSPVFPAIAESDLPPIVPRRSAGFGWLPMEVDANNSNHGPPTESPNGRDASPMSVASTVPADYDPTLPVSLPSLAFP